MARFGSVGGVLATGGNDRRLTALPQLLKIQQYQLRPILARREGAVGQAHLCGLSGKHFGLIQLPRSHGVTGLADQLHGSLPRYEIRSVTRRPGIARRFHHGQCGAAVLAAGAGDPLDHLLRLLLERAVGDPQRGRPPREPFGLVVFIPAKQAVGLFQQVARTDAGVGLGGLVESQKILLPPDRGLDLVGRVVQRLIIDPQRSGPPDELRRPAKIADRKSQTGGAKRIVAAPDHVERAFGESNSRQRTRPVGRRRWANRSGARRRGRNWGLCLGPLRTARKDRSAWPANRCCASFQFTPGLLRRVALVEDAVLHAESVGLGDQRVGRDEILLRDRLPRAAEKVGGLLVRIGSRTVGRIRLSQGCGRQPRFRGAIHGPRRHGPRRKNQCQRDPTDKCVCCRFQQSSPCETHPFRAGVFSRAGHRRRPSSRSNPEIPVDEDGLNSRRRPTGQEQFQEIPP